MILSQYILETLAIEMYNVVNGVSTIVMKEIFKVKNTFERPIVNSVYNGTETYT